MSSPGPRRPSWRDLPPTPPYGPVAPPRPGGAAGPISDLAPPVVPPAAEPGRSGLWPGAVVAGVVGLLVVLGAGIALGLLLTRDDPSELVAAPTPSEQALPPPRPTELGTIGPGTGGTQTEPGTGGQTGPGGTPNPGGGGTQTEPGTGQLPPGTTFDDLFGTEDVDSAMARLFDLDYAPDRYAASGTTVSQEEIDGESRGEQTTTLEGPQGEITVRALLGPEALARLQAIQEAAEPAEPVHGAEAYAEDEQTLAWLAGEDLLVEVHVPPGLEDELRAIAEGVVVHP